MHMYCEVSPSLPPYIVCVFIYFNWNMNFSHERQQPQVLLGLLTATYVTSLTVGRVFFSESDQVSVWFRKLF